MRTFKRMMWVAAIGVSFAALHAQAKEAVNSESKARRPATDGKAAPRPSGKAKLGEACKADADCDQSTGEMICGRGKCEYDVSGAHPET